MKTNEKYYSANHTVSAYITAMKSEGRENTGAMVREFSSEEMEFLRYSAPHGVQVPVDPDESGHVVKQEYKQDDPDDPQHRLR